MNNNGSVDRREYHRFPVSGEQFFIVAYETGEKLGTMLDVSRGGLSFRYLPNGEPLSESFEMDIVTRENNVYLSKISYENVSDFEINTKFYFDTKLARRRGLKFKELTSFQQSRIDQLIMNSFHYSMPDEFIRECR